MSVGHESAGSVSQSDKTNLPASTVSQAETMSRQLLISQDRDDGRQRDDTINQETEREQWEPAQQ